MLAGISAEGVYTILTDYANLEKVFSNVKSSTTVETEGEKQLHQVPLPATYVRRLSTGRLLQAKTLVLERKGSSPDRQNCVTVLECTISIDSR